MADSLLQIVIENLQAFLQDELATILGVNSQIQELSGNLAAIHAVLQDAEEKQIKDRAVKLWLQNLSDAAHVLDDILDECSIQSNRLQSQHCLTPFHPMTIMFRRDIGKRMKEMVDRFRRIDEERTRFELRGTVPERQQQEDEAWRQTSSAITEHHIYGRDQDIEKIVEFLSRSADRSHDLSVYPIVGMGGLGKTTLTRRIFKDNKVMEHFDMRIWVCVSTDFNTMKILNSIVESVSGHNPNFSTLEALQNKVQEILLGKRYLLVLDDVWSTDKWEDLKSVLLSGGGTKGSAILVTSRIESVASVMGTCPTHRLSPLSEDDNWLLFKYHAFGSNKVERTELVTIGKQIVKKCGGSPLASKALGSLLRNKQDEIQWLNVLESKLWDILEEDDIIVRALKISYFNLKLPLRRCFAFCAIFPEDFQMEKEQLIHLWMANGLIKSKGKLEIEDVGNEAWEQLWQRSFFQEVEIDELGRTTFKMHDLFHELAQSLMGQECIVYDKSARLTSLSTRVHHVTCLKPERDVSMDLFKKAESLRTMINLFPTCDEDFRGLPSFSSLRALHTNAFQLSALKSLKHLRYLNIRASRITTLPECISRLQKLQILKLEECEYLSCLPKHLTQLKDLRHLIIDDCDSLIEMPPNIGELKCLKTLNLFIVERKAGYGLSELRDLQLGGKLHIKGLENVVNEGDARDANLSAKKNLQNLYLSWDSSDAMCAANSERILEGLEPPSNLKSFGIKGYSGVCLPSWMQNTSILCSLVMVILYDCKNCERLPPLGKLPHLTVLYVSGMKDLKYIDDDSYDGLDEKAFKSLKCLALSKLPNLEGMLRDERVEMLPLVSKLRVSCVPKIKLPLLPSLEDLWIEGTGSDSDYSDSDSQGLASISDSVVLNMHHTKILGITDFHKLKALPHELSSLSSLQDLQISTCDELESFSENVMQGLCSLRSLSINSCEKLKSLSEGVGNLTCLERLYINDCPKLVSLPSSMNQLVSLRHIYIISSGTLPEGLQHVPSLQSLGAHELNSIPEWMGEITSLQKLQLSCEGLRSLPSSIRNLTNLRELSISGCHKKLQKRCKRGTGEDWQTIAHIPQFQLFPMRQQTFSDKIRSKWRSWQLKRDRRRHHFAKDHTFDYLVDGLFDWCK